MTGLGARRRRGGCRQSGMTMIELLVTIVVMGIAFSVIVGGLGISIVGSDTNRRQATAETVLRNFADKVKSGSTAYVPDCNAAKPAYESAFTPPSGFTATVVSVSPADSDAASEYEPCPAVTPDPLVPVGLQLVELRVTSEGRPVTESAQVVKREP